MSPGEFYGADGARFVRVAVVQPDERIHWSPTASLRRDDERHDDRRPRAIRWLSVPAAEVGCWWSASWCSSDSWVPPSHSGSASGERRSDNVAAFARAPVGCDTTLDFEATGTFVLYIETSGEFDQLAGECDADRRYDRDPDDVPDLIAHAARPERRTRRLRRGGPGRLRRRRVRRDRRSQRADRHARRPRAHRGAHRRRPVRRRDRAFARPGRGAAALGSRGGSDRRASCSAGCSSCSGAVAARHRPAPAAPWTPDGPWLAGEPSRVPGAPTDHRRHRSSRATARSAPAGPHRRRRHRFDRELLRRRNPATSIGRPGRRRHRRPGRRPAPSHTSPAAPCRVRAQ